MATVLAIATFLVTLSGPASPPADTVYRAGPAFGSFQHARRIALNPQGWIYVVDAGQNAVVIYKSATDSLFVLGGFGWSTSTFDRPSGIATDGLNVYVSDFGNHRIQRYDRYSALLSSLLTRDTSYAPARFGYPTGVALTTLGDLLVLDSENARIVEFSADSRFERDFGGLNTSGGKLQDPVKICVGGDQFVYVLEKQRIVEFDYFGNYLRTFGQKSGGEILGGQATASGIAVVSSDTLFWYSTDGVLMSTLAFSTLLADQPVQNVQDVAFDGERMFVLTPTRCQIFSLESQGR